MKTVAVSGFFCWIHHGHVRLFKDAAKLGDKLIVIVNNNDQQTVKKNKLVMDAEDIMEVIREFKCVDEVYLATDDDSTVCRTLRELKPDIFANGGDRGAGNVPEYGVCEKYDIEMVFGVGGPKIESSSNLLSK